METSGSHFPRIQCVMHVATMRVLALRTLSANGRDERAYCKDQSRTSLYLTAAYAVNSLKLLDSCSLPQTTPSPVVSTGLYVCNING